MCRNVYERAGFPGERMITVLCVCYTSAACAVNRQRGQVDQLMPLCLRAVDACDNDSSLFCTVSQRQGPRLSVNVPPHSMLSHPFLCAHQCLCMAARCLLISTLWLSCVACAFCPQGPEIGREYLLGICNSSLKLVEGGLLHPMLSSFQAPGEPPSP